MEVDSVGSSNATSPLSSATTSPALSPVMGAVEGGERVSELSTGRGRQARSNREGAVTELRKQTVHVQTDDVRA